ncbi:unnamed protein product [Rhizoctonia solani]|uniref:Uncharacterized protein n=1 Tax=Rhizoctonia solani TaxID=456999 RepID=A0A8H3D515_9AGAM|nr:unnamed protein product [Rhizoctonia solani]
MVSAPHLAQLVGEARDILYLILDVGTRRRARSLFVSYLRNIISLLESSLPSLSEDDAEIVRNLQSRLRDTLDKMTSHNRPLLYHLRYVLKSDEDLIDETRREIEDTLRLIEASDNINPLSSRCYSGCFKKPYHRTLESSLLMRVKDLDT